MSKITEAILNQNYEIVRDQIGTILADELANQLILQPDVKVLGAEVWSERFVVFSKEELPAINVYLGDGRYDNQVVNKQDGTYTFNIDCFVSAKTTTTKGRGDKTALKDLQRLMGVIRAILQSPHYSTLGLERPSVSHREVKTLQISDPTKNQDGANVMMGRLTFEVRHIETQEQFKPIPLVQSCTTVKIEDTDKGYYYKFFTTTFNFILGCYQGDDLTFEVQNEDEVKDYIIEYTTNGVDWLEHKRILNTDAGTYTTTVGITFAFLSIRIRVVNNDEETMYTSGSMPKGEFIFDGISYNSSNSLLSIAADNSTGVSRYEAEVTLLSDTSRVIKGIAEVNQANGGNYIIFVEQDNDWELIRVRAILEGDVCVYSEDVNVPLDSGVVFDSVVGQEIDCEYKIDWTVVFEDDIEKYEIYRNAVKIGEVLQGETYTFTDDNLVNGFHSYFVKAIGLNAGFTLDSNTLLANISCVIEEVIFETNQSTLKQVGLTMDFVAGSYIVDWGEGGIDQPLSSGVELTHNYGSTGSYTIKITGNKVNITDIDISDSNITAATDISGLTLASLKLGDNLLTNTLDLSVLSISGSLDVKNNTSLEGITFASSGSNLTSLVSYNCDLTGDLDLTNVPFTGALLSEGNSNLTNILFATSGNGLITNVRLSDCNLTGTLNLSNIGVSLSFAVFNNPNLTDINFSSTGNLLIVNFRAFGCNLGLLNLSGVPIGVSFQVYNNANLINIIHATSGNTNVALYNAYNCSITILNLANVPISGTINASGNIGLDTLVLGSTNGILATANFANCSLPNIDYTVFPPSDGVNINMTNNGMSFTEVDNQINNLPPMSSLNGTLSIAGTNAARTVASDSSYNQLTVTDGWTINVN